MQETTSTEGLGVTERLMPDAAGLDRAAALLREGQLVAFPTETVYGLGGDASNAAAVAGIYAAKGRPDFNPLIVHVPDLAAARALAVMTPLAERLAAAFWPGPLTLVMPRRADAPLAAGVTAGLPTVAIRCPAAPVAQALLRHAGVPVAAPSANPSGQLSPTTAAHVLAGLNGRIAAVLDGGPTPVGLESTILGVAADGVQLLRTGTITAEQIAALSIEVQAPTAGGITAPGQLASHYAPRARLRLRAGWPLPGEAWLGFGPDPEDQAQPRANLSLDGDLAEAAANLFACLHELDAALPAGGVIAVAPVPEVGIGAAINDRLRRAAAPRS